MKKINYRRDSDLVCLLDLHQNNETTGEKKWLASWRYVFTRKNSHAWTHITLQVRSLHSAVLRTCLKWRNGRSCASILPLSVVIVRLAGRTYTLESGLDERKFYFRICQCPLETSRENRAKSRQPNVIFLVEFFLWANFLITRTRDFLKHLQDLWLSLVQWSDVEATTPPSLNPHKPILEEIFPITGVESENDVSDRPDFAYHNSGTFRSSYTFSLRFSLHLLVSSWLFRMI